MAGNPSHHQPPSLELQLCLYRHRPPPHLCDAGLRADRRHARRHLPPRARGVRHQGAWAVPGPRPGERPLPRAYNKIGVTSS